MRETLKLALVTLAWGVGHSALASIAAKRFAARLIGTRNQHGLYRLFYGGQSLISFAALLLYARRLPERPLYALRGPAALLMRAGQVAGLLYAILAAREIGIARVSGVRNGLDWLRGTDIPPGPAAQGPEFDEQRGRLTADGPFRWSRHPLNFAPLLLFWLSPRLTTRRLGFNLASTLYLVLGSLHEEHRLKQAYDQAYLAYKRSGVPFYLPLPRRLRGRDADTAASAISDRRMGA